MGKPRKPRAPCPGCGCLVENLRSKFCSNQCQNDLQYKAYISRWLVGKENGNTPRGTTVSLFVRRYLFEMAGDACTKCHWSVVHPVTGKVPLTVNHKDGNWRRSTPDNIELLCPNCHALTPNFGALNRGNGAGRTG